MKKPNKSIRARNIYDYLQREFKWFFEHIKVQDFKKAFDSRENILKIIKRNMT